MAGNRGRALHLLEAALEWEFGQASLLTEALTHSTYANEHPEEGHSNERLEFLGDAVLNLLAARVLFGSLPGAAEGELTRRRAQVVRLEALAEMARDLDLAAFLRLGEGAARVNLQASGRLLADAFEALAGAVFLDGGFEAVVRCFGHRMQQAVDGTSEETVDFKTLLQEECHRRELLPPDYRVVVVDGPDHARAYTCEVRIMDECLGTASASSKKAAQQACACEALGRLAAGASGRGT